MHGRAGLEVILEEPEEEYCSSHASEDDLQREVDITYELKGERRSLDGSEGIGSAEGDTQSSGGSEHYGELEDCASSGIHSEEGSPTHAFTPRLAFTPPTRTNLALSPHAGTHSLPALFKTFACRTECNLCRQLHVSATLGYLHFVSLINISVYRSIQEYLKKQYLVVKSCATTFGYLPLVSHMFGHLPHLPASNSPAQGYPMLLP
ncbi:hypothetical protein Pcinc_036725 [Petrolisthes cinctipes]|uniref:Uncharacterized protein n=1 Tax=Petrolisthes cinctipes TaxID=88211 RepID=A0AAE1ENE1_PETCI|nr:hypothetical protein Pcinc_036725 [Petrolisthes cinctipes]